MKEFQENNATLTPLKSEFMVDQVIHRVFEGAGKELSLQVNGKKLGAGVDVFVARHLHLQKFVPRFDLDIYFGSRHDALMKILFLQLRYAS